MIDIPPENPLHKYAQKRHFKQYVILGTIFLFVIVVNLFRLLGQTSEVVDSQSAPAPTIRATQSVTSEPRMPATQATASDAQQPTAATAPAAPSAPAEVALPAALLRIEPVLERYDALIRSLELQKAAALQRGTQEDQATAGLMTLQIEQIRGTRDKLLLSTAQENGAAAP